LEPFGALGGLELDLLVLLEVSVPVPGDGAEVNEHIRAATVLGDETEAFFGVEPFHGAACHGRSPPFLAWLDPRITRVTAWLWLSRREISSSQLPSPSSLADPGLVEVPVAEVCRYEWAASGLVVGNGPAGDLASANLMAMVAASSTGWAADATA
jgi:hypothetical protein